MTRRRSLLAVLFAAVLGVSGVGFAGHAVAKAPVGVLAGKDWQTGALPKGVTKKNIDSLVATAMGDKTNRIRVRSVLIAINDKIVYERYHPLDTKTTLMDTMSVSKSVTSALVGMLVADGKLTLDQPAPVAAWADPNDPRHNITIRNLLNMSSGLQWREDYVSPDSSTLAMLRSPVASDYAAAQPLRFTPGSKFEYNSGNSAILMGIVTDTLGGVAATDAFIKARLLDPLGIKGIAFQRDPAGRIVGFMGINMTAREMARFGLLYLNNGSWGTKSVIPADWVAFSRTASPMSPKYAGHWWTYKDAFEAEGYYGQFVLVSSSKKMVMVITTATEGPADVQWAKATGLRDALYAMFPAA